MRGAAQSKPVREQARPVFARAQVAFGEAGAPQILGALFAVRVVSVAPHPRGEGLFFVGLWFDAGRAFVLLRLRGEQSFEGRARQFARIPWMVGANLRIAHT